MITALPGAAGRAEVAQAFCADFLASERPRYVLGRNVYAESLARILALDGIIDDYTAEITHAGLPVVRSAAVPVNALVINAAGGRPFSAAQRLDALGLRHLDYFAFLKWSGLPLTPVVFNDGFANDYASHAMEYAWLESRLADGASREILRKLVNFRLDYDLEHLRGFTQREAEQYFEPFLKLGAVGETFVDVGAYDGATSLEFIRRCPGYRAIHLFEPEATNFLRCKAALQAHPNVFCHPFGLSDRPQQVALAACGSASHILEDGIGDVALVRLDDLDIPAPSLIKIDTEGFEAPALAGAAGVIASCRPRIAVAVYHRAGDFWRIARQVLSVRPDYTVYLRHYTESIYETVMFFV